MKRLKKFRYKLLFFIFICFFIMVFSIVGVRAESPQQNYTFVVNDTNLPQSSIDFIDSDVSNLDTISIYYNDSFDFRYDLLGSWLTGTELNIDFIYESDTGEWSILDYTYKVGGVTFHTPFLVVNFHDFAIFTESNNIEYNEVSDVSKLPLSRTIIDWFFYNNDVASVKQFNFTDFQFFSMHSLFSTNNSLHSYFFNTSEHIGLHFGYLGGTYSAFYTILPFNEAVKTNNTPFNTLKGKMGIGVTYVLNKYNGSLFDNYTIVDNDNNGVVLDQYFSLLSNVITLPIYYLQCLFNFKILGINVYIVIISFVGVAILFNVIFRRQ